MGVVQSYKGIRGRVDKNEGGRLRVGKWGGEGKGWVNGGGKGWPKREKRVDKGGGKAG